MLDMEPLCHAADVKGQPVSVESASNQNAPPAADQNRNWNGNLAGGQPPAAPAYGGGYGAQGAGGGYGTGAQGAGGGYGTGARERAVGTVTLVPRLRTVALPRLRTAAARRFRATTRRSRSTPSRV